MKSFLKTILFLSLSCGLSTCGERPDKEWDMSLPSGFSEFHTQNAIKFSEEVFKVTKGKLKINVHPGAILGLKGPESIRALEEGLVDMAEMPTFQQVGVEPLLGLDSLPFLIRDQTDLRVLYSILRPKLEDLYASHNLKIIYMVPWPNQNFYTKIKTDKLSSLIGTKIRTYDRNSSELIERLGLGAVQLPSQDVVTALASGMVDGVMTSTTTGAAQKYWEFLNYIYRTNHLWVSNVMAVNLKSWNKLEPDVQQAVEDVAIKLEPVFWAVSKGDDQAKLKVLVENGIEVIEPSNQMMAEMRALATPMWQDFITRVGPIAQDIIEEYLEKTGQEMGT